jgi:large subunit ribosomal protein L21
VGLSIPTDQIAGRPAIFNPQLPRKRVHETRRVFRRSEDWRGVMKYAILECGGKQYKAVEGTTIDVDRLLIEAGQEINLDAVLMVVDGDDVKVGTPSVKGARVKATVQEEFKGPKLIIFKYRPKKRIRVKTGHREKYTRLMINSIEME